MGEPKALLRIGGVTLIERVVSRIGEVCASIVVVAQAKLALPRLPNSVRVVRDPLPDAGPLVGMAAGLSALLDESSGGGTWTFVSAVDAPFLSARVIERLFALRNGCEVVLLQSGDHVHPLTAVYETALAARANDLVNRGERRARSLSEASRTRFVSRDDLLMDPRVLMDDPDLMSFVNVNTRADWSTALARAALDARLPKGD